MEFYLESMNGKHDAIFDIEPKMAFSHAQLYLNVLNSTALRNYKHEQISVGVHVAYYNRYLIIIFI